MLGLLNYVRTAQPATPMENPMNASKTKGQSCNFLTLLLHLFPEDSLPSFPHLGHCGHGLMQPHSSSSLCPSPWLCLCFWAQSPLGLCFSGQEDTRGRRRRQGEKHLPSPRTARLQLGWGTGWGSRARTVLRWCSHRIDYACTYFISCFIAMVANTSGISLGPPVAQCLYLPMTLASFCVHLPKYLFLMSRNFLV